MSSRRELLSNHWQSFEGIIPSVMSTASRDGTPNVAYISQVYYIDEDHVALSNQFMSKTVRNVMENPRLQAMVVNAITGRQIVLDLMFERSETAGPMFEQLAAQISAVAEHHGMAHVMKLRSADIYRVLDYCIQELDTDQQAVPVRASSNLLAEAVGISLELAKLDDLDAAIQLVLDKLQGTFGFGHCMVLFADEDRRALTTIAARGYDHGGAGAEVPWGLGVVGIAAEKGRTLRFSAIGRDSLYINNVATTGLLSRDSLRVIPMPGLKDPQSLLAVPMISGGEVRGVIFAESQERVAFSPFIEPAVSLIAAQLAGLVAAVESSRELEAALASPAIPQKLAPGPGIEVLVNHYPYDDSIFLNNEYVIKGVPGRILWRMLQIHVAEGRTEFTNREFRLDASLKLPEFKDNLETRLLLLSRRLAERDFPIRIGREGRGRVKLRLDGKPLLTQTQEN
jgi:adenylate cyclase